MVLQGFRADPKGTMNRTLKGDLTVSAQALSPPKDFLPDTTACPSRPALAGLSI